MMADTQEELFDTEGDASEELSNGDDTTDVSPSFTLLGAPKDFAWELTDPVLGGIRGTNPHPGFGTFELNLNRSLADQLGPFFDSLETAPLTLTNINSIQDGAEGVYALYIDGKLSYVGKSNAQRGLKQRLKRHRRKLSNRKNVTVDDVRFKAAQIYSFSAFNVETLLLLLTRERAVKLAQEEYQHKIADWEAEQATIDSDKPARPVGRALTEEQREMRNAYQADHDAWKQRLREHRARKPKAPKLKDVKPPFLNNSGFGSNDTGAERDTQKTSPFDRSYPLDIDCLVDADAMSKERIPDEARRRRLPKTDTLLSALDWFSENVSFTFRVSDESKESLRNINVDTNELFAPAPMRTVLARISEQCPDDWTVTVMKGKVLAYEGQKKLKDVELHLRRGMEVEPNEGEAAAED